MSQPIHTGTRIRERRTAQGMKQADLAQRAGISASYLNLIEHNRRRIGGKLLLSIAEELGVEPQALSEGAEAELLADLRAAATIAALSDDDTARAEEFASRFPAWANAVVAMRQRVLELEHRVAALSERISHDPQLAASVHELLTTVASVRSTASILTNTDTLEPEWQDRFLANIDEDSRRLARSAEGLVEYLEKGALQTAIPRARTPEEALQQFVARYGYHFPPLEDANHVGAISEIVAAAHELDSAYAKELALALLQQVAADAEQLPLGRLRASIAEHGAEPLALAKAHGVDFACVLRRIASLPEVGAGLLICDEGRRVTFAKHASGFEPPKIGETCVLDPILEAQGQLGRAVRLRLSAGEPLSTELDCFAVSQALGSSDYNRAPSTQTTMLVLPVRF